MNKIKVKEIGNAIIDNSVVLLFGLAASCAVSCFPLQKLSNPFALLFILLSSLSA